MRNVRNRNGLGNAAVLAVASAVVTASAGLFAITVDHSLGWTPEAPDPVSSVQVTPWSAATQEPAGQRPFVEGINLAAVRATVRGTSPATVTGAARTPHALGAGLTVVPAGLTRTVPLTSPPAPVPVNDNGGGNFTALPGVSSGSWGVTGQTGAFTWSYPFSARKAPAGPTPALGLAYDSSSIDGLTSSTNNQASVVGDGWSLAGAGSIRQKFAPCMDQGVTGSYDLCGAAEGQQFSISFGGRSGQVIKDKDAVPAKYKLQNDDNTRVEYLTDNTNSNGTFDGGYWKLTDTSGTQYFFGRNHLPGWDGTKASTNSADTVPVGAATPSQPCAAASFAASVCQQAYAWNLDYVVDVNNNSEAFYYTQDTNTYSTQQGTGPLMNYVRSSRLARVDYGMRAGTELSASSPLRIELGYTGRCTGVDCSKGNDIPTGFACQPTGTCAVYSPTFYNDQRLQTVSTRTNTGPGAYQDVDVWTLGHSMPDPGDGTKPALWLGSVAHQGANTATGVGGAISDPAVTFEGQALQNRVWVYAAGIAPLDRYRISTIRTVTGASITVSYLGTECSQTNLPAAPETNTKRCFPQWWTPTTPIAQPARMDYFHIYPVAAISTNAGPGANGSVDMSTRYEYQGTPAWKYAAPAFVAGSGGSQLTWSVNAGWSKVKTITGNTGVPGLNPSSMTTYLRGLDGTPSNSSGGKISATVTASDGTTITDSPWFAGSSVETQKFVGETGPQLSTAITVPWASPVTATGGGTGAPTARHTGTASVKNIIASSTGAGTRTTTTSNTFDNGTGNPNYGRITAVSNSGETGGTPGSCTVTAYADSAGADNTGLNLLALPATTTTYAGPCTGNGAPAGNIIAATGTLYDSSMAAIPGAPTYQAPTLGNPSRTDTATAVNGTTVTTWKTGPTLAYDALGRVQSSTDNTTGTARTTQIAYAPATGLPASVTTTNPLGWTTTTAFDSIRGNKTTSTDENLNVTSYQYDASGRITGVWDPMRPKASNATPTQATAYTISKDVPSSIARTSINGLGHATTSYEIYDGLGRLRQTQKPSPRSGTMATDTTYNSIGAKLIANNNYQFAANPSAALMLPDGTAVPSSDRYGYDGAGRLTTDAALAYGNSNAPLWTTNITYTGADTTTTTTTPGTIAGNDSATATIVNAAGKTVSRQLFHGTTPTGTPDTTSYSYDALGRMTSMTDTAGNQWSWAFDTAGRQTTANDPDTGTTTTSYDASGRVAATTDGAGNLTSYAYDALDRTTGTSVTPQGGTAHTLTTSTYDGEKKGQPSSATRFNGPNYDQQVTTAVSGYNAAYQPATTTTTLPGGLTGYAGDYTTTRAYTSTGNIATEATPAIGGLSAETITNNFDDFENPSAITTGTDTIAGAFDYTEFNQLAGFQQFDANYTSNTADTTGLNKTQFNWDATTGRLARQSSTNQSKGAIADLGVTNYTYTASGKLSSREQLYPSRPGAPDDYQCYSYDYASRLSAAWTAAAKNCNTAPTPASTSVPGLGGPAPYAQTYAYTPAGDRSQVKRFDNAGNLAATENYAYPGAAVTAPGAFSAQAPFRQLDTRNGTGGIHGTVGPGQTIRVKVTGQGGIPATGVSAVAMNITVTNPSSFGAITAYAGGTNNPGTSNLNYATGQTVANFAVTPVGADGTIAFTNNSSGTVDLLADTSGYYLGGAATTPGAFSAQTPFRQLDTRNGTGGVSGPVGPNQTIRVKVTGQGGIPATGVSAVAMNITVANSTSFGAITAYAGGTNNPGTSNLNYATGQIVPNFAITPVGSDGTIAFTNNSSGTVQIIADTSGYFLGGTATVPGAFSAQTPFRQLDTRNGTGGVTGPVGPGQTISVKVTGRGGLPATGVSAIAMNITVANSTSSGVITAYAGGTPKPGTSNLNYTAGQIIPNFAITAVGADGTISFTNDSPGTVQLIADTMGYFNGPVTGGLPGAHQLQSMTSTPATGTPATSTFTWDAAGRMTGRAGETLAYTADGKLATTTGSPTLPANPNPSATAGTPPAPLSGTAGSTGTRYYDAGGNLVGITDGTGTTATIGSITAHSTPAGVKTATKTYGFAGKTVAQRTAAGGTVKLAFIISDGVDTTQTILQPSSGTTPVTAQTRYTDPIGLARGPTQTAAGAGAYATAAGATTGVGSNAANVAGYGAVNGYIGGLADTISTLTHLGARDLDPVLGTFTSPDPILKRDDANNFSPYVYGEADAINNADPSGLMILSWAVTDGPINGGWHAPDAVPDVAVPSRPTGPLAPGYTSPVPGSWQFYIAPSWTRPRTTPAPTAASENATGPSSLKQTLLVSQGLPPDENSSWATALRPIADLAMIVGSEGMAGEGMAGAGEEMGAAGEIGIRSGARSAEMSSVEGNFNVKFGSEAKLGDHFNRHGSDFRATSAEQYEKMASEFLISPLRGNGTLQKIRGNGDIVRYDPKSGEFGVLSNSGVIRTYYIPDPARTGMSNMDYFIQEGSR
ncbi:RHS repeat-associated core domain-containing protein [Arthrobacter ramosus]|uniref:RHS repeat-associated core domain-containing protein n=1 Tax=Arthrobacter ramosus TaxID=1672 RepID=A0ABV5Y245_ARTRM|nr:RHS repeat-associated core domain-containing protein [Arthrobacter ramosus]